MTEREPPAVLVTGATGQIGQPLVKRLLTANSPVVALCHRRRVPNCALGLTWVDGDLADGRVDFGSRAVDRLVHATGLWLLPHHLPALHALGIRRVVAFGSTSIFGKAGSGNQFERRQISAIEQAEQDFVEQCSKLAIAWTILRPTLTYGAGIDRNVSAAARFIERFGFYPIAGPASGLRQPVHADDLAAASVMALAAPTTAGKSYDLGGGETLAYRDMIGRIFDALGRPRRFAPVPLLGPLVGVWGRISGNPVLTSEVVTRMNRDLVFDHGDAARDFGYAPREFLADGRADLGI